MAVVTGQLARAAITDWPTVLLGAMALVLLLRFRVNSAALVLLGALAGAGLRAGGLSPH
jgi:chromate transporter